MSGGRRHYPADDNLSGLCFPHIKVTSGGPGEQTVTIDGGDVPLAGLPDLPASPVEIDDGEIPLAALPKTGQTTMKLTLTLMFSGIFLALAAMSKKHKEEES